MLAETSVVDFKEVQFNEFLNSFKTTLNRVFEDFNANEDNFRLRAFPTQILSDIMSHVPLSVAIANEYGGRGAKPAECMSILQAASYHSIPLTLIFGINIALFLEPVGKYGQEEVKQKIFTNFLHNRHMGGLMITEPDHGSDALNMKTSYRASDDNSFHVQGTKHWQGLTGMADYWLVAARKQSEKGHLSRDVDLIITDDHNQAQHIEVTELYQNNGLYPIPYGKNKIDIQVPQNQILIPESTGIKMIMDTLHRSRMQFPGMAIGFIQRTLHDIQAFCDQRLIRGKALSELDKIKSHILEVETSYTLCAAMCHRSAQCSSIDNDLSLEGLEANTFKSLVSDLMQETAQIHMQLLGAKGYNIKSLGSRGIMDSRPFQIFEGPNDMLNTQSADMLLKYMSKAKRMNLKQFCSGYALTKDVANFFGDSIDFELTKATPQRKLVILGKTIGLIVMAQHVQNMYDAGYNEDMFHNCMDRIKRNVNALIHNYHGKDQNIPASSNDCQSNWFELL